MSLKLASILLLLSCLNITLADQDCYVKLYPEEDFNGNYVRAIFDSTLIKDWEFKSLKIIGNCIWDLHIIRLHGAGGNGGAMINKNLSSKLVSKLVPGREQNLREFPDGFGREFNKFDYRIRCEIFGFFSSRSLKTREKYINFAQFVYFLREVCLLFNF